MKWRDIMKKVVFWVWLCFSFLSVASAFSQNSPGGSTKTGTLTVLIDGFNSDKGTARIALCNSIEGYKSDDKAFRREAVRISDRKAEWAFRDLPFGEYVIKVFHDENGNHKLDRNLFGAPTEAYGFSNNARAALGPPDYKKAMFQFGKTGMTIRITVQ